MNDQSRDDANDPNSASQPPERATPDSSLTEDSTSDNPVTDGHVAESGPAAGDDTPTRVQAAPPPEPSTRIDEALTNDEQAVVEHTKAVPKGSDADLWAFRFDSSLRAQEALLAAMRLVARKHLTLEDAAIVTRVRGRVRITQTKDISPTQGAVGGAWIGILAGLFLGPPGPLIGGALGAAAGGLFGKLRDLGIDDDEMRRMGDDLDEGQAALFLLVEDCHRMRALHEVSRFPGTLLASTADDELVEEVKSRLAVDPWSTI